MKKHLFVILMVFLFSTQQSAVDAKETTAQSEISSVVVYSDRAMIARTASLSLSEGIHTVAFESLPVGIIEDSVRVTGKGTASTKIAGIELKKAFLEKAPEEKVKDLEGQIQSLQDEIGSIDAQIVVLSSQKSFLESLKVSYAERISKELSLEKPKVAELGELLRFLGENLLNIANEIKKCERTKREAVSRLDVLKRQLNQIKGQEKRETRSVEVSLDVSKAGNIELELSYVIHGASWNPVYDIRLSEDGKKVEMTYRAFVSQRTGEDWKDVALSLSTARPAVGANPPELSPWYVELSAKREKAAATVPAAIEPAPPPEVHVTSESPTEVFSAVPQGRSFAASLSLVQEQTTAVLFLVPRKENIPSDGFPHNTTISVETFDAKTEYLCVPKLSSVAYLRSEIVNPTNYPLLAGKANVFMGANFTGNAYLERIAPTEKFDLFFGIDEAIKVKREVARKHKEAGIAGKNKMTYQYTIEIQNFKKDAQTITVLDQLPVSRNEEIKIRPGEFIPEPQEKAADGTLKWILNMQPQEKKEIVFEFQAEYPKDREAFGL